MKGTTSVYFGGRIRKMVRPPFIEGGVCASMAAASAAESSESAEFVTRRRSFPLKDDAGYIGYLTDGEDADADADSDAEIRRRRRELVGSDVSFSNCMLMMITVCGLIMLFLFAVSPWGIPPPRRL